MVYRWMGLLANIKCFTKKMGSKVDCFAGFYHHCLATISMPTHVNFYYLFKSGIKTGLWTTPLCRKYTTLLPKYKNNSKNDFSLNNKYYIAGYGELSLRGDDNFMHFLIMCFVQNIWGCDYYIILLLYVLVVFRLLYIHWWIYYSYTPFTQT